MSNYFLVKWVAPTNINFKFNICIRRSIVNTVSAIEKMRAGDEIRIKKRGMKVERLAIMFMRSGEIQPLLLIREMLQQLEAMFGSVTNDADSSSERYNKINELIEKLMQQLRSDANNNQVTRTARRNQSELEANPNEWVLIGSGSTRVPRDDYEKVNWRSYTIATRTLLCAVFPRRTLATHSLTGKKSPAFQNKPAKMCLDIRKTSDVIIEIMNRFKVKRNLIRNIITIKCADECKMKRTRDKKKAER